MQLTVALVALVALLHTPPAHADDIDELLNEFDEEDEELLRHIESQQ